MEKGRLIVGKLAEFFGLRDKQDQSIHPPTRVEPPIPVEAILVVEQPSQPVKPELIPIPEIVDPLDPESKVADAIREYFAAPWTDENTLNQALRYVSQERPDLIETIYSNSNFTCPMCGSISSSGPTCPSCDNSERPILRRKVSEEKVRAALRAGGFDEEILFRPEQEQLPEEQPKEEHTQTSGPGADGILSPDEVTESGIPQDVIDVVNQLIQENLIGKESKFLLKDVVARLVERGWKKEILFKNHYLDFEPVFRKIGWIVEYDDPAYNDDYEASFTFTRR